MSEHDAISTSRVSATQIKSNDGSSEIRLSSSSDRLPRDVSIDCQRIEEGYPTIRAKIRQAIVADKELSLYAQNIEIFLGPRGVTLCGSVKSHEERRRIERGAAAVIKVGKVFNKLAIRPSRHLSQTKFSRRHVPNEESRNEQEFVRIRRLWGIAKRSEL